MKLRNRVAVVTGAASGIGRATAVALASEGCDLALADLDDVGMRETARQVERLSRRATMHHVDVADRAAMRAFAQEVEDEHLRVHVLVNNAGVSVNAPFAEQSLEDFEWLMGVNFWGVVHGCKLFLPLLRRAGEGTIVNLSSLFGLIGLPTQSSYCASKFAVRGFSESLLAELASENINVLCVHPGGVNTNIAKSARWGPSFSGRARTKTVQFFEERTMPAEEAATRIVDAVKKDRVRLLITREAHVTDAFKRLFPGGPKRVLLEAHKRLGFR